MDVARNSYLRTPTGGMFHLDDLTLGEELLIEARLVQQQDDWLYPGQQLSPLLKLEEQEACEVLLLLILKQRRPLWSQVAIREDRVFPELIPEEDTALLQSAIPDPNRREALLLTLGKKLDLEADIELGSRGEEAVVNAARVELCEAGHPDLAGRVQRVSIISDQLGYDVVAPTLTGTSRRMEVKTVGRMGGTLRVFLSRNEAEVGLRDPQWYLVICHLCEREAVTIAGWQAGHELREILPSDTHPSTRWKSVEIVVSNDNLTPGLPPLQDQFARE